MRLKPHEVCGTHCGAQFLAYGQSTWVIDQTWKRSGDGRSLELLSQVDTFVFDTACVHRKTGTLTEEVPTVGAIHTCYGISESDLLRYAAAAEHKQSHPIAQAIRKEALMRELDVPPIGDAKYEVGYGLVVSIPTPNAEQWIRVGSRRFMEMEQITIPSHIQKAEERCFDSGYSLVYLAIDEQLAGAIELQPTIRPLRRALSVNCSSRT